MRTLAFSLMLLVVAPTTPEAAQPAKPVDGPVPAKLAAGKMTVPEGFKVTLFAGEPDIVQPIAFTFDDRGRMWVVECLSYPRWSKDGKGSDRVVILEDTDGDGTFNKKTVFMDNGVNLSGIELGFGGVWLCSSPNLLFVKILEGDKPGEPEVILDGWNMTDTKHNIFNSLGWGPDGWLYGCNGIQAKAWVGRPGTPKEKRQYMDCGVWRVHPTRGTFEPVAHGTTNPFGLDWDENGEMFITNCVIDHLFHIVPGGHYQRMYGQDPNPHTYGLMKSCVDYRHWAGGDWTSSRGTGVGGKPEHSDAGGGHAHSGCAIYLGDNFPAEYRNTLFTANIHSNRLNNDGLARTPSGMKGVRRKDFLFANDSWFRGICVKVGPDGALYVSDWCDTGECHNYDKCDITNGRIYRVVYKEAKPLRDKPWWPWPSEDELVKMQLSPNEWLVRSARRALQARAATGRLGKGTPDALRKIVKEDKETSHRLRGLWALESIGVYDFDIYVALTGERDEVLRAWGYRLLLAREKGEAPEGFEKSEQFKLLVDRVAKEPSEYVRLHLAGAISCRTMRGWQGDLERVFFLAFVGPMFESLLFKNSSPVTDSNLELMMWYTLERLYTRFPMFDKGMVDELRLPLARRYTVRRILDQAPNAAGFHVPYPLMEMIAQRDDAVTLEVLSELRMALAGKKGVTPPKKWSRVYPWLLKAESLAVRREAEAVAVLLGDKDAIAKLSTLIGDSKAAAAERVAAIELLRPLKLPEFAKTLRNLLDDPAVRTAAIRGLAAFADADTPAAIIKAYPKFTTEEKLDAVQTLAARKEWANALLDAIEKKDVPRADIPVTTARQILALNDKALSTRLDSVWGKIAPASQARVELTKKWKALLTEETLAKASTANGRALFTKHCGACHKMFGEGQAVGPELTGSQRSNLEYVLENVLDPSAVVPREFQMVNFTTMDDRVISGIVLRETKDAITIRTTNDTVVLPTGDIATRKQTNVSIMPDGLFEQMKPEDVRDLVAYLRAKEQVPLPK